MIPRNSNNKLKVKNVEFNLFVTVLLKVYNFKFNFIKFIQLFRKPTVYNKIKYKIFSEILDVGIINNHINRFALLVIIIINVRQYLKLSMYV